MYSDLSWVAFWRRGLGKIGLGFLRWGWASSVSGFCWFVLGGLAGAGLGVCWLFSFLFIFFFFSALYLVGVPCLLRVGNCFILPQAFGVLWFVFCYCLLSWGFLPFV